MTVWMRGIPLTKSTTQFVVADESMRLDDLIVSTKDLATVLNHWR